MWFLGFRCYLKYLEPTPEDRPIPIPTYDYIVYAPFIIKLFIIINLIIIIIIIYSFICLFFIVIYSLQKK